MFICYRKCHTIYKTSYKIKIQHACLVHKHIYIHTYTHTYMHTIYILHAYYILHDTYTYTCIYYVYICIFLCIERDNDGNY